MPVIFRATFPTLGSFITLPVLLWLWAPLMGHPGAGLVKLVGRFILLLGLALSFKAHWVGEGSLELGLGLFLRFFFLFCLFIFWGDRFVCLFGFFFWASPRDVIENCHLFSPPRTGFVLSSYPKCWWLWMCAAIHVKRETFVLWPRVLERLWSENVL